MKHFFSYFAAGSIVESQPEPKENISFADFMERTKSPLFEPFTAYVQTYRYGSEEYKNAKKTLPFITPHGTFKRKHNDGILKRSGIFCFDVDLKDNPSLDINVLKSELKKNPYCVGYHSSPSGGISFYILVDVDLDNWKNHTREYGSLFDELESLYCVELDKSQKALSQARYCSFDPEAYHNPKAKKKDIVIKRRKAAPVATPQPEGEAEQIVTSIIDFLKETGQSLTASHYNDWVNVGFSIGNSIPPPAARAYFHRISAMDAVYDFNECNDVYDGIDKSIGIGAEDKRTIASLIASAKAIGYELPANLKGNEPKKEEARENTKKGAYIEAFLEHVAGMDIKRNEITRLLDLNGQQMTDKDFNTIWMDCHMIHGINISIEDIYKVLDSDITPTYNPIHEYFKSLKPHGDRKQCLISHLSTTIKQDTYEAGYFWGILKKWMVGTVAGAFKNEKNVLQLVLSGKQNTGKTEFFRRILPAKLHRFYAENKLDDGKDSEILMCQSLIIMDDEYGGKSKMEAKRLKELSSKVEVTVRLPYGKTPVTLQRIATLCGTTNDPEILGDTTGNRRVIPVNVLSRNFKAFDAIDKNALWAQAYTMYKNGFDYELTRNEIALLEPATINFNRFSSEYELITKYFDAPTEGTPQEMIRHMTATEILVYLRAESGLQRLTAVQIGKEMSRLGFVKTSVRNGKNTKRVYPLCKRY